MEDNNSDLIQIWKNNSEVSTFQTNMKVLNSKNQTMETLIHFEKQEKQDKLSQIFLALFFFSMVVYTMIGLDISRVHLYGIIMLTLSLSISIISNRTDKFPDIRQLNTRDYLSSYKEYILYRSKIGKIAGLFSLPLLIVGLYLTFKDSFSEILGPWWMPIMYASALFGGVVAYRGAKKRSDEVLEHVNTVLTDLENDH